MHEFSRRSLLGLNDHSILSATLSFFSSYLEGNVKKEVDKDALIIREAAQAYASERPACDLDLEEIFEKTKTIDQAFLNRLLIPSFTLQVRYSDFADIRIQRIWRIARTVYALLGKWSDQASFNEAVRYAFSEEEFTEVLAEILHLYSLETRMLGDSIRSPFHSAIQRYLESLFQSMESVRVDLARTSARALFRDRNVHA